MLLIDTYIPEQVYMMFSESAGTDVIGIPKALDPTTGFTTASAPSLRVGVQSP